MKKRADSIFKNKPARISAFVVFIFLVAALVSLGACAMQENPEPLDADQVNIFYGVSSWAMFGADEAIVAQLVEMYNNLELQKTEDELDFLTAFAITFYKDDETVGGLVVDENGLCRLAGADTVYKILFDSLDYGAVRAIYENSMDSPDYVDGIYQGGGSAAVDALVNNVFEVDWPRGMLALIAQMSDTQKKAFIAQPVKDGTVEYIARQIIGQWIASYTYGSDQITFIDAEISDITLVATYDENSSTPLYLYEPQFRLLPDDPDKLTLAGALSIDDDGWLVDGNERRNRMLLTPAGDNSYHYLGTPEFDIPVNTAIRELIVDEPEQAWDFTLSHDFMFILGRQFGDYPWGDYDMDIPDPQKIDQSDMPGMDFYQATFGPRVDGGAGETVIVYYTVAESGYTFIQSMHTTDPYVSTGINGDSHHIQTGKSEKELLAAYPDALIENRNMVYGPYDFCPYDKVYEYAPTSYYGQQVIRFYLNGGKISGIEMFIVLD